MSDLRETEHARMIREQEESATCSIMVAGMPPASSPAHDPLLCPCCHAAGDAGEAFTIKADEAEFWQRAASAEAAFGRVPCPTCEGEGRWTVPTKDPTHEDYIRTECQDCYGHGTLRAPELVTMVLELRAANGELHDAMAGQQASHEAEMLDAARSSLVRLCRELDLPIYEDPRNGIRGLQTDMAVLRDWLADSQGHVTYLKTLLRSAIETMRKAKNSGFAEIAAFCVEGRLSAARDMAVSWIAEMEAQASALEDDHG